MEPKIILPSPSFNKISNVTKNQQIISEIIPELDSSKIVSPKPKNFEKNLNSNYRRPHFSSPDGMLLSSSLQPPPMYGPRGATLPPKYIKNYQNNNNRYGDPQLNFTGNKTNTRINENRTDQKHWCDICDQYFSNQIQLETHKSAHCRCNFSDCNFIGTRETLNAHIEQHNNGFYDKIKSLNSPEEIEKWKAERRKNYPTISNVELRRKAFEAKMNRGEKLSDNKSKFGKKQDRKQMGTDNHQFKPGKKPFLNEVKDQKTAKRKRNPPKHKSVNLNEPKIKNNASDLIENKIKFKGTSFLKDYKTDVKKNTLEINPLSSLLGMYGSSADEDSSSDSENSNDREKQQNKKLCPTVKITENYNCPQEEIKIIANTSKEIIYENAAIENEPKTELNEFIENGELIPYEKQVFETNNDDMPEEKPIIKEETMLNNENILSTTMAASPIISVPKTECSKPNLKLKSKILKKSILDYSKLRNLRRQNTVLSKLLEKDIRHERNLLLQCVRYVIANNFFGTVDADVPIDEKMGKLP